MEGEIAFLAIGSPHLSAMFFRNGFCDRKAKAIASVPATGRVKPQKAFVESFQVLFRNGIGFVADRKAQVPEILPRWLTRQRMLLRQQGIS